MPFGISKLGPEPKDAGFSCLLVRCPLPLAICRIRGNMSDATPGIRQPGSSLETFQRSLGIGDACLHYTTLHQHRPCIPVESSPPLQADDLALSEAETDGDEHQ